MTRTGSSFAKHNKDDCNGSLQTQLAPHKQALCNGLNLTLMSQSCLSFVSPQTKRVSRPQIWQMRTFIDEQIALTDPP